MVSALGACGASGVAGGSLLLIPMACNLFGIPTDVAMQVVAIGFIIGVVQDSVETALNSSTDVLFTAAACRAAAWGGREGGGGGPGGGGGGGGAGRGGKGGEGGGGTGGGGGEKKV